MENVIIPGELLEKINITPDDLLIDLAAYLYDKERLGFGQARQLARLDVVGFQKALKARGIYLKYDTNDLQKDLENLGLC